MDFIIYYECYKIERNRFFEHANRNDTKIQSSIKYMIKQGALLARNIIMRLHTK